ncbi:hypothetical protein AXG93_3988s1050 [Marchantia polymorpha subsp. ruderalis]|uniref:Uncharacterized protein n=1 Tax=Marchantia polymorpha subsp. ruderalis TaxID=1480154 RepID=A0A176VLR3_MARPO|nr:hypothetical protein AXG93_3988s1050 [Marchantia polymorpha subsp. ruderalis]
MLHSADSLGPACVSSSAPEQIELEGYLAINNNDASSLVSGSPKDAFEIELLRADGLAGGRAGGYLCLSLSLRGGDCDAEEGRGEEENRGKERRGERRTENGKGRESGASLCWS